MQPTTSSVQSPAFTMKGTTEEGVVTSFVLPLLFAEIEDPTSYHAPSVEYADGEDAIRIRARLLNKKEAFEDAPVEEVENYANGYLRYEVTASAIQEFLNEAPEPTSISLAQLSVGVHLPSGGRLPSCFISIRLDEVMDHMTEKYEELDRVGVTFDICSNPSAWVFDGTSFVRAGK